MKIQNMTVPPTTYQRGSNIRRLVATALTLLAVCTNQVHAQDGPPIPPTLPPAQPPRELTPEEIEAQRKAQETLWQQNREWYAPTLHSAPVPEPEDLALKQRLISAELLERQRKEENDFERDERLKAWAAEVRERNREAREQLRKAVPAEVLAEYERLGLQVELRDGRLVAVAPMNVNAQKTIGAWKAKTNAPADYPLNASGRLVGMWERSVPGTNHTELNNGGLARLIYLDSGTNIDYRAHATQMAGTIAAAGINSDAAGMASSATILAKDTFDDTGEMGDMAVDFGVRLSNHSYGLPMGWDTLPGDRIWYGGGTNDFYDLNFGSYRDKAYLIDSMAHLHPGYLSVWPTGNDRDDSDFSGQSHLHLDGTLSHHTCNHASDISYFTGYRTLTPESTAKNILSVSSIGDLTNGWQSAGSVSESAFSNRGPTRDGRTKPDLAANGETVTSSSTDGSGGDTYSTGSGTSSAAASVTGAAVLAYERLEQTGILEPSAALVKTVLFMTADEAGPVGPDYQYGRGVMNTSAAVNFILTNKYYFNTAGGLLKSHLFEGVLTNGTSREFTVNKNAGQQLKAELVWTDPAGYYSLGPTNLMLVNDLDVEIVHAGVTNLSYALDPANPNLAATATGNFRDNTELNVWTNTSLFGSFTIRVKHKGTLRTSNYQGVTTNQPFVLGVAGHIIERVPEIVSIAQTASNQVTVGFSGTLYQNYKVQFIDEVDAPANAWSDSTGWFTMTNNPAAVALTMPTNAPQRFYRVARQL